MRMGTLQQRNFHTERRLSSFTLANGATLMNEKQELKLTRKSELKGPN